MHTHTHTLDMRGRVKAEIRPLESKPVNRRPFFFKKRGGIKTLAKQSPHGLCSVFSRVEILRPVRDDNALLTLFSHHSANFELATICLSLKEKRGGRG